MKQILFKLLFLLILSCGNPSISNQIIKVEYKGALKNMMHKGDISAKADLSEYENIKNFYALGAFENLKGEIQIFDSQPYNSFVEEELIKIDSSYSKKATLFVYSIVEDWAEFQIPTNINTKNELEKYIENIASENRIDTDEAFPFLIEGKPEELNWHVINWKEGDTEHSHEKHIESGLNGTINNQEVEMLGFYSDSHHAIFTHHTTNMHIHMKLKNGKIAGHVDDLRVGHEMILKLPKIE